MKFWNWGPTTIWHNLTCGQNCFQKSLHPNSYSLNHFVLRTVQLYLRPPVYFIIQTYLDLRCHWVIQIFKIFLWDTTQVNLPGVPYPAPVSQFPPSMVSQGVNLTQYDPPESQFLKPRIFTRDWHVVQ